MINFKPISIEDKEIFDKHLSINRYNNSEYSFTTLFTWQEAYNLRYDIINNCLCVFGGEKNKEYCYFPLGEKQYVADAFSEIYDYFKISKQKFRLISVSEEMLSFFETEKDNFEIIPQRGFWDYVYNIENFTTLKGKKLHGKRNHFNYFINNYKYDLVGITPDNEDICIKKLEDWISERSLEPKAEFLATTKALKYRDELALIGKLLYVENEIVGIILGQYHHDIALISIAKSDVSYRGASVALFNLFLKDNLTDCSEVNLMEDLGIDGLRNVKLSYNPSYMVEKYFLKARNTV